MIEPITDSCPLCDQWCDAGPSHRACALREVLGGIGHLVDHDRWCVREGDPDAGMTYRESALCVMAACDRMGADTVIHGINPPFSLDTIRAWAGVS